MQSTLGIENDCETLSDREKRLTAMLRKYRKMDGDIRALERKMKGIGLLDEPRITMRAPEKDLMPALEEAKKKGYIEYSTGEREMAAAIRKNIGQAEFAEMDDEGRVKLTWVSSVRAARAIERVSEFVSNNDDYSRLQDAHKLLTERLSYEAHIHLTDSEKVAEKRLEERERAKQQHDALIERRDLIRDVLRDIDELNHEWYLILWHRYVLGSSVLVTCRIAAREGEELTRDEYLLSRKRALHQFDAWTSGLLD